MDSFENAARTFIGGPHDDEREACILFVAQYMRDHAHNGTPTSVVHAVTVWNVKTICYCAACNPNPSGPTIIKPGQRIVYGQY